MVGYVGESAGIIISSLPLSPELSPGHLTKDSVRSNDRLGAVSPVDCIQKDFENLQSYDRSKGEISILTISPPLPPLVRPLSALTLSLSSKPSFPLERFMFTLRIFILKCKLHSAFHFKVLSRTSLTTMPVFYEYMLNCAL